MRESLANEIPDTAPYTEWLAIVGSIIMAVLVCSPILKRHPNLKALCLRLAATRQCLALSALHAGKNGGGHVLQKQSTREG